MTGEKKVENKKCKYASVGYKCSRKALSGDIHCIFHSKDIEGKKDKFNNSFWKEFERQKEHEEIYDFTGFVFPGDISFEEKEFKKDVNFWGSQFFGYARFYLAKFAGKAEFWYTQFSGEADFAETKFSGKAYFLHALFSEKTYFGAASFSGSANFSDAQFHGYANFLSTQFSGSANFSAAQFVGEADFTNVSFLKKVFFNNAKFKPISNLSMEETFFYDVSGLLEILDGTKKARGIPRKIKTEFLSDKIKIILGEKSAVRYPLISRQIQDDWYLIRFKENHKTLHFLWWLFANCGRSILRWALWSMLFAVIFAAIFNSAYQGDIESFQTIHVSKTIPVLSFLYYSIVTFTTLGFGDIIPKTDMLQFWVMLEVIIGYIMLGGLISILANKLARRS